MKPAMAGRVALAASLAALGAAAGCHEHEKAIGVDEFVYDCESAPAGSTSFASDESFMAIVDKEFAGAFVVDDARAAAVMAPAAGSVLSVAAPPPAITLQAPQAAALPSPSSRGAPGRACPPPRRSRWARVWDLISFEGTAYAHCPGVTGTNYLFRLEDAAKKKVYTAILSVTSFTPNAAKWRAALASHQGQTLTLTLARAVFTSGSITDGPYVSSTAPTFTVVP